MPSDALSRCHRPHRIVHAAVELLLLALAVPARAFHHVAACALGALAALLSAARPTRSSAPSRGIVWWAAMGGAGDALALCLALVTGFVDIAVSRDAGRSPAHAVWDAAVYGALALLLRAHALVHALCETADVLWEHLQHDSKSASTSSNSTHRPSSGNGAIITSSTPGRLVAARLGAALVLGAAAACAARWGAVPPLLQARAGAVPATCAVLVDAVLRQPCFTRTGAGRVHRVLAALPPALHTRAHLEYCLAPAPAPPTLPCWVGRGSGALTAAAPRVPGAALALASALAALALAALGAALAGLRPWLASHRSHTQTSVNVHPVDYGTLR